MEEVETTGNGGNQYRLIRNTGTRESSVQFVQPLALLVQTKRKSGDFRIQRHTSSPLRSSAGALGKTLGNGLVGPLPRWTFHMFENEPMQVDTSSPSEREVIRKVFLKTYNPTGPNRLYPPQLKNGSKMSTSEITKLLGKRNH